MKFEPDLQALAPWVSAFGVTQQTRIATPSGSREAGDLAVGDLVNTRDDGPQPLSDVRQAIAAPSERNHYPVRIPQGALGFGLPHTDLFVGPQHRVLFEHIRVPLLFGVDAVMVRAKSLAVSHDRVHVQSSAVPMNYVQLSTPEQSIIFAEGVPVETIVADGAYDLDYTTLRAWELMAAVA